MPCMAVIDDNIITCFFWLEVVVRYFNLPHFLFAANQSVRPHVMVFAFHHTTYRLFAALDLPIYFGSRPMMHDLLTSNTSLPASLGDRHTVADQTSKQTNHHLIRMKEVQVPAHNNHLRNTIKESLSTSAYIISL